MAAIYYQNLDNKFGKPLFLLELKLNLDKTNFTIKELRDYGVAVKFAEEHLTPSCVTEKGYILKIHRDNVRIEHAHLQLEESFGDLLNLEGLLSDSIMNQIKENKPDWHKNLIIHPDNGDCAIFTVKTDENRQLYIKEINDNYKANHRRKRI
ncbi:MAG: hypothetical protein PHW96_01975 [Candidatus Nanoarchaeia archaeon]|nr:hypothetical protein [Candidatus Nanoarchaeia archaeon]